MSSKNLNKALLIPDTVAPVEAPAGVSVSLAEADWRIIQRAGAQSELKAVARKAHERGEPGIVTAYLWGLGCPSYCKGVVAVEKSPAAVQPEKYMPAALRSRSRGGGYYTVIYLEPAPGKKRTSFPADLLYSQLGMG